MGGGFCSEVEGALAESRLRMLPGYPCELPGSHRFAVHRSSSAVPVGVHLLAAFVEESVESQVHCSSRGGGRRRSQPDRQAGVGQTDATGVDVEERSERARGELRGRTTGEIDQRIQPVVEAHRHRDEHLTVAVVQLHLGEKRLDR
ncbi:hypothetical protein AKG07_02350 [Microbacterium sp. CGR1]|nr:hypothetical protein AKG07_02350 [Microbacterium sp. CGR1]